LTDDVAAVTRQTLHRLAAKERVVLQTKLPEVLADVARVEVELYCVLVESLQTHHSLSSTATTGSSRPKYLGGGA